MCWMLPCLLGLLGGPVAQEIPDDHVVARVRSADGAQSIANITAGRLRAYAQSRPDTPPKRLLMDLIDFELLAFEANLDGLDDSPEVLESWRPVMVQRFLRAEFEPQHKAEAIPKVYLRRAYRQNLRFFSRPALRQADHILVTDNGERPASPDLDAVAGALAEQIRQDLKADLPKDADDFRARAEGYRAAAQDVGLQLKAESLGTFAKNGRYDQTFSENAFGLTKPGEISKPFATRFGHHIVRLESAMPALDVPFEEAIDELRERVLPDVRRRELSELLERLAKTHSVSRRFEPLVALEARRTVDPPQSPPGPTPK